MDAYPLDGQPLATDVTQESLHELVCRTYEAERMTLYRYLASLGLEPEVAKDLAQESFVRFYVALKQGDEIRMPRAWLFSVASHLFLNWRRSEATHPRVLGDAADRVFDSMVDPASPPDEAFMRRQRLIAVADAIEMLSPQQRICLRLRAEGLRYREIAEVVGVSVPTVSEFVRRAIARLKRVIDA